MTVKKKKYLLIPGAWMGAWIWEPTIDVIRSHGHAGHTLTLSGLDQAQKSQDISNISLETHINDVLAFIEKRHWDEIVLVGHSYSGIVVAHVADRIPEKINHIIYVNAFLPQNNKAMVDAFGTKQAEIERREIIENKGWWQPPTLNDLVNQSDLSPDQQRKLSDSLVPHPGRTVTDIAQLTRPLSYQKATYIACRIEGQSSKDIQALCESYGWKFHRLNAGHWPMISNLDRLLQLFQL